MSSPPPEALTIELVPSSAWGQNLRAVLTKRDWDVVRKWCYSQHSRKCELCGGVGDRHPVECHERWAWDEETLTQYLSGVMCLCPACHEVKHWERTCVTSQWPSVTENNLVHHVMKVNGWPRPWVTQHLREQRELFAVRSLYPWTLDVADWLTTQQESGAFALKDWSPYDP